MQVLINLAISLLVLYSILLMFVGNIIFGTQTDVIILVFPIGLGLSWVVLSSYFSTWKKLAQYYRVNVSPAENIFLFQSGSIGSTYYRNCLKIGVLQDGIYLFDLSYFLAPFHKPLLIPWNDIGKVSINWDDWNNNGKNTYHIEINAPTFATKLVLPIEALENAEVILISKIKSKF